MDELRLSLQLSFVGIRQGARRVLDLVPLELGSLGRFLSALILSAVFFLVTLPLFWLVGTPPLLAVGTAILVLVVAQATSAVLIFWSSDDDLEAESVELRQQLREARQQSLQEAAEENLPAVVAATSQVSTTPTAAKKYRCDYCDKVISGRAVKCPHCHEYLDESYRPKPAKSGALAALLSFFIPGLGQAYQGRPLAGLCWFFVVVLGHMVCFFPGIIIRVMCIFDAAAPRND